MRKVMNRVLVVGIVLTVVYLFVEYYLPLLAERFVDRGILQKEFIGYIWKGFAAMVANDGSCTNEEVFWKCFQENLPFSREELVQDTIE